MAASPGLGELVGLRCGTVVVLADEQTVTRVSCEDSASAFDVRTISKPQAILQRPKDAYLESMRRPSERRPSLNPVYQILQECTSAIDTSHGTSLD